MVFGSIPASRETRPSACERTGRSVWTLAAAPAGATRRTAATAAMAVTAEHARLLLVLAGLEGAVRGIFAGHRRPRSITFEGQRGLDECSIGSTSVADGAGRLRPAESGAMSWRCP